MTDVIDRIQRKLAYLRQHEDFDNTDAAQERQWQLHAIRKHRYHLSPPLAEAEVAKFEAEYRIDLPADYRLFLLEIGNGGAGPGYDLLELNSMIREKDDLARPFPFTTTITTDACDHLLQMHDDWDEAEAFLSAGHIMVGYSGCQCWDILIITGDQRGYMWYMDGLFHSPIKIANGVICCHLYDEDDGRVPDDAVPVTFSQWYEAWLDESIATAYAHWRKRGRDVPVFT
jgi:hypothetical protein